MHNAHKHILLLFMLLLSFHLNAQLKSLLGGEVDTIYIQEFPKTMTTRIYFSMKYTRYDVIDNNLNKRLKYTPNDKLVAGIGANYGAFGLNVGIVGTSIKDENIYGKSDYLDLQSHLYLRKLVFDFIGQYYTSYFLSNPSDVINAWPTYDTVPVRPDMKTYSLGLTGQYIFNHKKFSYRASFIQTEWQKKSAGSFTLGGNIHYITSLADSSHIPHDIADSNFFSGVEFHRSNFFSFGANAGYSHTFVIARHIFISLSVNGGISLGFSSLKLVESEEIKKSGLRAGFDANYRGAIGYNSMKFYIGLSYVNVVVSNQAPVDRGALRFDTGNIRFNIVYRFTLKKDIKILDPNLWGK